MAADNRFFLYFYCNDLAEMREFYSKLLGLGEIYYSNTADGGLGYHQAGVQVTILPASEELAVETKWHRQPGWAGGTETSASWSFQVGDMAEFRALLERLHAADVPRFYDAPRWHGYWSFPVKDPMGNTVEVTHAPESEPAGTEWQDLPAG